MQKGPRAVHERKWTMDYTETANSLKLKWKRKVFRLSLRNGTMGCIYRIVCHATGKSYVGQSAYSHPFVRYREHWRSAENGEEGALYEDMRMYGHGEFECVCVCVAANEALNNLEGYYAEVYGAYVWDGGYNRVVCGTCRVSEEMSDAKRLRIKRSSFWKHRLGYR